MNVLLNSIQTASDKELQDIMDAAQAELDHRRLRNFVGYVPNYITDELAANLIKDGESLDLPINPRKHSSQWLSPVNEPYIFNDTNPIHHAKNITEFPAICKVRDLINADPGLSASVDSCLVFMYPNTNTAISPHSDNEDSIDQQQPICNISLGVSRTIEFITSSAHKHVASVKMHHRSLTVMKAGAQSVLKHTVRPENNGLVGEGGIRWCFSFRARAKRIPTNDTAHSAADPNDITPNLFSSTDSSALLSMSPLSSAASVTPNLFSAETSSGSSSGILQNKLEPSPSPRRICLLAGDSYAARLDPKKLGKSSLIVESVAKGGARMHHVMGQLRSFREKNTDVLVEKMFISVGTNDIRYCNNGVSHLSGKLKSLCSLIRELYPESKVYFQSLIPLPCIHKEDWLTNSNVIDFNSMIFNECKFRRFYILDAFSAFRDHNRPKYHSNPELRNSLLFNGRDIHPSARKGMGVLAKLYLRALHSRHFDPFIWQ